MLQFRDPIDDERRDEIIEAMANQIVRFGMTVPAIFFLEMSPCHILFGDEQATKLHRRSGYAFFRANRWCIFRYV